MSPTLRSVTTAESEGADAEDEVRSLRREDAVQRLWLVLGNPGKEQTQRHVFKDDYERGCREGQVPAVAYTRGFRPDTISRAYNTVAVGNLDEKKSPMDSAEEPEEERWWRCRFC